MANAFAGGVFISIATMHIMPEQVGNYQKWHKKTYGPAKVDEAVGTDDDKPLTSRAVSISHLALLEQPTDGA